MLVRLENRFDEQRFGLAGAGRAAEETVLRGRRVELLLLRERRVGEMDAAREENRVGMVGLRYIGFEESDSCASESSAKQESPLGRISAGTSTNVSPVMAAISLTQRSSPDCAVAVHDVSVRKSVVSNDIRSSLRTRDSAGAPSFADFAKGGIGSVRTKLLFFSSYFPIQRKQHRRV